VPAATGAVGVTRTPRSVALGPLWVIGHDPERPLRRKEIEALGTSVPDGPILGARVEHVGAKEALLADDPGVFFTTPHFDGHPSILVRLDRIAMAELDEVIIEAWLCRAPPRLAREYVETPRASAPSASSNAGST